MATQPPAGLAPLIATVEALVGRTTELVETTRGLSLNHTLWSGTRTIPAVGHVTLEFSIPMATVAIAAIAGVADIITAQAGPPAGAAPPTEGPGVLVVPAGWHLVAPLTGPTLTVWGAEGDRVHIVVMSRLMPPTAGGGGAIGGTP